MTPKEKCIKLSQLEECIDLLDASCNCNLVDSRKIQSHSTPKNGANGGSPYHTKTLREIYKRITGEWNRTSGFVFWKGECAAPSPTTPPENNKNHRFVQPLFELTASARPKRDTKRLSPSFPRWGLRSHASPSGEER